MVAEAVLALGALDWFLKDLGADLADEVVI